MPLEVIRRPHAESLLPHHGQGGDRAVTLVCAPAGYGKTALVSNWARARERASEYVAWLNVDESDDDPTVLCTDVLVALGRAVPEDRDDRLPRQSAGENAFVASVADIVDRQRRTVWLVIDDLHRVRHAEALHALEMLLRWLPRNLRLVICTRQYPTLGLHRLRIAGSMREVAATDLAFTEDQIEKLLSGERIRLNKPEMDKLVALTEGWPVAVRLAELALADSGDHLATMDTLVSSGRAVDDYVTDEVLDSLSTEQRHLLRCISVMDTFTPELAVELTEDTDAPAALADLERSDPLVCQCPDNEDEYRVHPFLRAYLYAQLKHHSPANLAGLHRAAARWFASRGDPVTAARHGIHAGDPDLGSALVVDLGLELLLRGETSLVLALGASVPPVLAGQAEVGLTLALAELMAGDRTAADLRLAGLTDELAGNDVPRVHDLTLLVRMVRNKMAGRAGPEIEELGARLSRISDTQLLVLALVNRGATLLWFGQYAAATRDLEQAMRMAKARGFDAAVLDCMSQLSGVAAAHGDFPQMLSVAEDALALAERCAPEPRRTHCAVLTTAATAHYQMLSLDRAAELVGRAADLLGPDTESTVRMTVLTLREAIDFERGLDPHEAMVRLRGHWATLSRDDPIHPTVIAYEATLEQRMALRLGQIHWALDAERRASMWLGESGEVDLLRARLHAHHGRIAAARHLLEGITGGTVPTTMVTTTIEAHILAAILGARAGNGQTTDDDIRAAIELAEPRRVIRPFFEMGSDLRQLLATQMSRLGRLDRFVAELLDAIPATRAGIAAELTPREMELLRELPSLATLEEIAESLYVSVNTVKTHIRNVYRKLGVASRREAVVVARRNGLI